MTGVIDWLFGAGLPPRGVGLKWPPGLTVLHVGADLLLAAAYVSIPLALAYFIRRRGHMPFNWIFGLFAAFILLCGLVHLIGALTAWRPWYGLEGLAKLLAAGVSVAAAIVIWPLIPRIVSLPSPEQYASVNRRLQKAMDALTRSNAELENRVTARTAELEEVTRQLEHRRQEAERAAEERAMLLREMHHRTGNNLQIISSFVGLTLRGVKDPAAANAIREIRARLAAITDVNRLLLRSDTLAKGRADEYLQRLTDDLIETLIQPDSNVKIVTDIERAEMSPDALTYLGLVAVELITNAVKYAYPAGQEGSVIVRLRRENGGLLFEVSDSGVGFDPAAAARGPGAGATIVRQFAARLGARVEQEAASGKGVSVRLLIGPEDAAGASAAGAAIKP